MNELTKEDIQNFKKWSEGNRELFELLYWCKKYNITTFSSCGGHPMEDYYEVEEHGVDPYISIVIDSSSVKYIEKIISELRDVSEVEMQAGYMKSINKRNFDIHALPSNCSEVFHKIKLGIIKQQLSERGEYFIEKNPKNILTYLKERQLINGTKKIEKSSDTELSKIKQDEFSLSSISNEFKNFRGNISTIRYFKTGITIPKRFLDLYEKYGKWQKQYNPEQITCYEDLRTQIINNEFEDVSVDLCVNQELQEEINQKVWDNVKQSLINELQSKGIPFEVERHSRDKDSSYYTRAEKLPDGSGKYYIDIPNGLEYSTKDNPFDSRDLFEYVYSMMHEYRHIMQRKEYCFGTKETEENKSYAKAEIISEFLSLYDADNYANDPREIDAQIYGIEQAVQYFRKNFPWLDAEKCCVEFVKNFAQTQKDNKFKHLSFSDEKCNSLNEILVDLKQRRDNPVRALLTKENMDYEFYCVILDDSSPESLLRKKLAGEIMEKYNNCEDANQKDDMLVEAISEFYPDVLKEYPILCDKKKENENNLIAIDRDKKIDDNWNIKKWFKSGRRQMGVGLEKVKAITSKYRNREDLHKQNSQKDIGD